MAASTVSIASIIKAIIPSPLKRIAGNLLRRFYGASLYTRYTLLKSYHDDYRRYTRYSSTIVCHDEMGLEALIIRLYHALETSLTFSEKEGVRGVDTAKRLAGLLEEQAKRYGVSRYARLAFQVLCAFAENLKERNVTDSALSAWITRLQSRYKPADALSNEGGIVILRRGEIAESAAGTFESLVRSRHSVRTYAHGPVDDALIERAIALALRCPTACNRQPARVYDLRREDVRLKVLGIQNNATGWRNEPDRLLLLTADMRVYQGERERSAAYIDGSLFAMTLIYALHSMGLGTCCLNLNLSPQAVESLRKAVGASGAEVPIMLVVAGLMKNEFAVPVSTRRNVDEVLRRL